MALTPFRSLHIKSKLIQFNNNYIVSNPKAHRSTSVVEKCDITAERPIGHSKVNHKAAARGVISQRPRSTNAVDSPDTKLNRIPIDTRLVPQRSRSTHIAVESPTAFQDNGDSIAAKPWAEVPGPRPLPLLGNTWRFIPYIGGYSVQHIDRTCVSLQRQYGRCVRLAGLLGRPDMLFVFDANEVERIFRGEDALPHRPSMPSLDYYKHVLRKDFFGAEENCAGVIAVHGEPWATFRGRVARVALSAAAAAPYAAPVASVADDFVTRVRAIRDKNLEMPDDFLNELHKWSLESLALVALDSRLGCLDGGGVASGSDAQRLIDAVHTFFLCVGELELRAPWWRLYPTRMFRRYIAALDTILDVTLRHVQRSLEALEAEAVGRDAAADSSRSLLQQLVASAGPRVASVAALDLFLVGIDTTSNAVASILYQLSLRADVQERLHAELQCSMSDGVIDMSRMHYLKAVVKEVLRMYPVVIGNGRQLTKDTVICGYHIPKGTQVIFQHYVMSNSEEYFGDARSFKPERWLRSPSAAPRGPLAAVANPAASCPHHPYASLPFGYGKRMCLGRRFADLEIQTIVCKMVQAFKIEYHHEPLEYHIHPMYTPNGPLRLKFIDR